MKAFLGSQLPINDLKVDQDYPRTNYLTTGQSQLVNYCVLLSTKGLPLCNPLLKFNIELTNKTNGKHLPQIQLSYYTSFLVFKSI